MALLVPLETPASFWRSEEWRQIVQLRVVVIMNAVQLVFWVFQYPFAALLSLEHIWKETTAHLARSFLVSM